MKNAQEVPQLLDTMQEEGVDGVKLYTLAKPDVTRAVITDAHRRGLPVTAHLGATLPSVAADAGIDNLEHVTTLFQELRTLPPHTPDGYGKTFAGVPEVDLNGTATRKLIATLVRHHVTITPTFAVALLPWQGAGRSRQNVWSLGKGSRWLAAILAQSVLGVYWNQRLEPTGFRTGKTRQNAVSGTGQKVETKQSAPDSRNGRPCAVGFAGSRVVGRARTAHKGRISAERRAFSGNGKCSASAAQKSGRGNHSSRTLCGLRTAGC